LSKSPVLLKKIAMELQNNSLRTISNYKKYVETNLINEIDILMNNDRDLVYAEIAKLSTLGIKELRELWKEKFGANAPLNAKRKTLVAHIGYYLREQAFGTLSNEAKAKLDIFQERFERGEPLLGKNFEFVPGMILTREYNGRKHSVKILDDDRIEYNRQTYKSLSAVAREITGIRWNGREFFHINRR
jgi:hypothetical protein